jgi:hypothetical protein
MNQELYKGFVICDHYSEENNELCYLVCKDFGDIDPYWEIFSEEFKTKDEAKFFIDHEKFP